MGALFTEARLAGRKVKSGVDYVRSGRNVDPRTVLLFGGPQFTRVNLIVSNSLLIFFSDCI